MDKKEVINQIVKLGIKVTKTVEQTAGDARAKLTEYQIDNDVDNVNLSDAVNAGRNDAAPILRQYKKKVVSLINGIINGLK